MAAPTDSLYTNARTKYIHNNISVFLCISLQTYIIRLINLQLLKPYFECFHIIFIFFYSIAFIFYSQLQRIQRIFYLQSNIDDFNSRKESFNL